MARTSKIHLSLSTINGNNRFGQEDRYTTTSCKQQSFNMSSLRGGIPLDWSSCITPISLFILLLFTTTSTIVTSTSLAHSLQRTHDKPTSARSHAQMSQILRVDESGENSVREQQPFDARSYGTLNNHTKDNLEQSQKPLINLIAWHTRRPRGLGVHATSLKDGDDEKDEVVAINHDDQQASTMTNSTQIASSMTSALISATTMTTTTPSNITEYATVYYNGVIGVNATDPFAIATESRTYGLPIEIQILMCLLYGTLAFTAVTSNLMVCYIVLSNQRMRTATNYFIVNLAVGDILMALLCIPFTFPANLIFQYWPFGLSLCVIVSYSQANSVFISAYTMVAISIDKYIAIMYPMRLRMPKNQAKMIILVIWSAALITSLPTALLSSLTPATPDLGPSQPSTTPSSFIEITTPASVFTNPSIKTNTDSVTVFTKSYQLSSQVGHNMTSEDEQERLLLASSRSSSSSSSSPGANTSGSSTSSSPAVPTRQEQSQQQWNREYEEQKKYFCQESWLVWPGGKYYYSMALMVLQFVVPLFVLVVTYTRIVIVVWGKRVPGEEDNARDARMARSKRKMIRMVIFCVIAFALTWLPFNALIVIGDMRPDIWETQNIMYIWFITHYLAMCHTITNPLIYIWMNNRFRAGFTQVVGDVCRFLHRLFAYLLCHCLCMGCCLDCSRQKYARVEQNINRKRARRGPLASSGSIHAYNYHNHNNNGKSGTSSHQHPHHHYNIQTTTGGGNGASAGGGGHKTLSSNDYCTKVTSSGQIIASAASNGNTHSDQQGPGHNSTTIFIKTTNGDNQPANASQPIASTSGCANAGRAGNGTRADGRTISSGRELQSSHAPHAPHGQDVLIAPQQTLAAARRNDFGNGEASSASARRPTMCLRQARLFRRLKATDDKSDSGSCAYSASRSCRRQHSTSSPVQICDSEANLVAPDQRQRRSQGDRTAAEISDSQHQSIATAASETIKAKKRRRKHSHGISLHMTQPYRPSMSPQVVASGKAHTGSCAARSANAATVADNKPPTTSKWRSVVGVRRSRGKQHQASSNYSTECPSCQRTNLGLYGQSNLHAARKHTADAHVRFHKFMYEFCNSSQSTATISAQTNNTSLAITPLDSTNGGGPNGESANTSASLSPNGMGSAASGPGGKLSTRSARQRTSGRGRGGTLDNSITVIQTEQPNGSLALGTGAQLDGSSGTVEIVASDGIDSFNLQATSESLPSAVVGAPAQGDGLKLACGNAATSKGATDTVEQIEHSIQPAEIVARSPLECAAYQAEQQEINAGEQQRQEHLSHRRQSVDGDAIGDRRLHVNEIDAQHHRHAHNHHRDSGGTLSEATSLEGHQLASSTSASESCNQSDPAHSGRQHSSDGSAVQTGRIKFCPEHRQTASAAEVNPRGHHCDYHRREMSFPPTHSTDKSGAAASNGSDDHLLRNATAIFCSPLNEIGAQVGEQLESTCTGQKSSSTFELVSEHLLHVRQLPYPDCLMQEQQQQQQQHQERAILESGSHNQQHVCNDHVSYLHHNGHRESFSSNNDDEEDDSSLEAEYGEIRWDSEHRFADNFGAAESIQLRPLAARGGDGEATKQMQHRNRWFSSTSDGLCSTHSHDDNRRPNEDYDLRTRKMSTSRVALATCVASANSARNVLVGFETGGQRGASNEMDHGSTVINFCDIPNKTQPSLVSHGAKMVRKSSLHNGNCGGDKQRIYQTNHHRQHTKSMSPIHLGRQGSFIVAAANDNAIVPNGARNF